MPPPVPCHPLRARDRNREEVPETEQTKRNAATENQFQVCFSGIESSLDLESNTEHTAGRTDIHTDTHTQTPKQGEEN